MVFDNHMIKDVYLACRFKAFPLLEFYFNSIIAAVVRIISRTPPPDHIKKRWPSLSSKLGWVRTVSAHF